MRVLYRYTSVENAWPLKLSVLFMRFLFYFLVAEFRSLDSKLVVEKNNSKNNIANFSLVTKTKVNASLKFYNTTKIISTPAFGS
jgi:hypothetical protein